MTGSKHSQLSAINSQLKKGYKQTEVGVIPEDWTILKLSDLGQFKNGINKGSEAFGHGSPFVNLMDVFGVSCIRSVNSLGLVDTNSVEQQTYDLRKGDVLFIRSSVKPSGVGLTAVVEEDIPQTVYSGFLIRFRDDGALYLNFKRHCFSETNFRRRVIGASSVSANTNINQNNLKQLYIAIPLTHAEQKAIAEALSDVDDLIGSLEKLIAKKRAIKTGAMQQLLTGKQRLPGFEGAWETKSFGNIFDYHSTATNSRSDLNDDSNTYYVHYGDIHTKFHSHLDFRKTRPPTINRCKCKNATCLKNGDWVMADASEDYDGVGKSIEIHGLEDGTAAVAGLHTFLLREKNPTFVTGFKGHLGNLKSLHDQFLRVATGMKVYGVSKTALKDLMLPVPHPAEQTAIAEVLSDMDAEIQALEAKLRKTKALKQGMMQELLTGKTRLV